MTTQAIVVIGAGLTGCSVVLELARRGYHTLLLDRFSRPMWGTSSLNGGKFHLGYVYSKDRSFSSPSMQLKGALTFDSLMKRWCGEDYLQSINRSRRFAYLQASSSLLNDGAFRQHALKVRKIKRRRSRP